MEIREIREKVIAIIEPVLTEHGVELVDLELCGSGRGQLLRLLVDREGGVDLTALSDLSRELSDLLDVEDAVRGSYTLEVSSPGINRPLTRPDHYVRYLGKRVRLRTRAPIDGQRNFVGELATVTEGGITLRASQPAAEVYVPFADIERANYEHDFSAADFAKRGVATEKGHRHGR
jgi:ribosome maturation factor RimP